jgi:hypothetical protein
MKQGRPMRDEHQAAERPQQTEPGRDPPCKVPSIKGTTHRLGDAIGIPATKDRVAATTVVIVAELIGSDRCTALGLRVRAYAPVLAMCRELIALTDSIRPWSLRLGVAISIAFGWPRSVRARVSLSRTIGTATLGSDPGAPEGMAEARLSFRLPRREGKARERPTGCGSGGRR